MTPFPAHVAFFVVARFAFAFAVDLAFALALIAILALSFALVLAVAAAFAFALAFPFALACVVHVHRNCFSQVIHDPRPVRVRVDLDNYSQLVVITLKLLRVHQQRIAQFFVGILAAPH